MPDFSLEKIIIEKHFKYSLVPPLLVGVDEAGCGPWAGPVVAGSVVFPNFDQVPQELLLILDDSKKMTQKKRTKAFNFLTGFNAESLIEGDSFTFSTLYKNQSIPFCYWSVGNSSPKEIDKINIRQSALLAMARAVDSLPIKPEFALVDGIAHPTLSMAHSVFKKGDGRSFSIAAASVIAKVCRDIYMKRLAKNFPHYGWHTNAGYGTKTHQEGLKSYGVTEHHRKSFAPISRLIEKTLNNEKRNQERIAL